MLSKEIGGNISEKERTELQQTLTEDRRIKEFYDEIHTFMQEKEPQNNIDIDAKLDEVWDKIAGMPEIHYQTSQPQKLIPVWGRIAVTVAILIGLAWLVYHYYLPEEDLHSQVMGSGDENLYAVLDNGTQV